MDGHLYDVQCLLKNGLKSDSFAAHYGQHFQYTTSHMDLKKCMTLKLVNQINLIVTIKYFNKRNYDIYMEEYLTTLKKLRDKMSHL